MVDVEGEERNSSTLASSTPTSFLSEVPTTPKPDSILTQKQKTPEKSTPKKKRGKSIETGLAMWMKRSSDKCLTTGIQHVTLEALMGETPMTPEPNLKERKMNEKITQVVVPQSIKRISKPPKRFPISESGTVEEPQKRKSKPRKKKEATTAVLAENAKPKPRSRKKKNETGVKVRKPRGPYKKREQQTLLALDPDSVKPKRVYTSRQLGFGKASILAFPQRSGRSRQSSDDEDEDMGHEMFEDERLFETYLKGDAGAPPIQLGDVDSIDYCVGKSDDEFSLDDESDIEDILSNYDSDGLLKVKIETNDKFPQLPPEFQAFRKRRFKSSYVPHSMCERDLFTKGIRGKRMTSSLGKRDYTGVLCKKLIDESKEFIIVENITRSVRTDTLYDENQLWRAVKLMARNRLTRSNTLPPTETFYPRVLANKHLLSTFSTHFGELSELFPVQELRIEKFIEIITENVELCLDQFFVTKAYAEDVISSTDNWFDTLNTFAAENNTITDMLELYKQTQNAVPPEFDENSIWGLKPLRRTFLPPFFKDWRARAPSPALFKTTLLTELTQQLTTRKQKWTVKDVAQLEKTIRTVVLEKKLHTVKQLKDRLLWKINKANAVEKDKILLTQFNQRSDDEIVQPGNTKYGYRPSKMKTAALKNTSITSHLTKCENIPLGNFTTAAEIRKWHSEEVSKITLLKYEKIFDENFTMENVAWDVVSAKIMQETKKLRLPMDCKKCFEHGADPSYNNKRRWSIEEKNSIMDPTKCQEWKEIGLNFAKRRPEFVVFYKWRNSHKHLTKMEWTKEKDAMLGQAIDTYDVNWNKIPTELDDFRATKKQVQERFKKSQNRMLRFGKFTRVEDCLLVLTIEKLKGQLGREKHFGILTAYLPWRYESAWRDRAENLFAEYIVPWTMLEDEKLLSLAASMKRDWSKIAKQFTSFKTRKGCLTRYKILEKQLARFSSLQEYHHSYAMVRYNVQEYRHFKEIAELLNKIMKAEVFVFSAFERDRPPTESELQDFILSFDRNVMAATIRSIETWIKLRNEFWEDWRNRNGVIPGEKKRTHDRRTFHPENTQSIASALHIRDVKLIPRASSSIELTEREKEIYKFYAQFCSTKPLKKDKPRPYIPLATTLAALPDVMRIVLKDSVQQHVLQQTNQKLATGRSQGQRRRGRPLKRTTELF